MLIDRVAVKQHSKEIIRNSRPSMLTAGLIFVLLSALIGWLSLRLTGVDAATMDQVMECYESGNTERLMTIMSRAMPTGAESLLDLLLHLALAIVSVGFAIFTLNTVRKTEPVLGNLLDGFARPGRVILLIVLQYVFIFLWSLLLIVPGVIAAYRYSLATYILIDHPELSPLECIRESKRMTKGFKAQLFKLDLSFILWLLLSSLPIVGYAVQVYLTPYMETAKVLYYEQIRSLDTVPV